MTTSFGFRCLCWKRQEIGGYAGSFWENLGTRSFRTYHQPKIGRAEKHRCSPRRRRTRKNEKKSGGSRSWDIDVSFEQAEADFTTCQHPPLDLHWSARDHM